MTGNRGLTLVELMVSLTIMIVAVTATCAILIEALHLTRNAEEVAQGDDASRMAAEAVINTARLAGFGSTAGIYVKSNGAPRLINPVFGSDGAGLGATDDLWLVIPGRTSLRRACIDPGAASPLTAGGFGQLKVTCNGVLRASPMLLVSNMTSSALISPSAFPDTNTITYDEQSLAGFSDRGFAGYTAGDMVHPVSLIHFFVATNPATGAPALTRCRGVLRTNSGAIPFIDSTTDCLVVQNGIEDFQVAYGFDPTLTANPDAFVYQNGLAADYGPGLRSLRINVVATGQRRMLDESGKVLNTSSYAPFRRVENHLIAAPVGDGFRRSLYSRRLELVNLDAVHL